VYHGIRYSRNEMVICGTYYFSISGNFTHTIAAIVALQTDSPCDNKIKNTSFIFRTTGKIKKNQSLHSVMFFVLFFIVC
jgi:hypothetical protein